MFISQMAFFAKVSDPLVGGTYMTLLNTVSNLGGTWTKYVSLAMLDKFTYKQCISVNNNGGDLIWRAPLDYGLSIYDQRLRDSEGNHAFGQAVSSTKPTGMLRAMLYLLFGKLPGHHDDDSVNVFDMCNNQASTIRCQEVNGECRILIDGYIVELCICTVLGVIWLWIFGHRMKKLQLTNVKTWHVRLSFESENVFHIIKETIASIFRNCFKKSKV